MKPTITWLPVLQALYLRDYNPAVTSDDHFLVCVNPQAEMWNERAAIMREFRERFEAYGAALKEKNVTVIQDFESWSGGEFEKRTMDWYARLLSFGEDKYTADELRQIESVDVNLLNWLFSRSIQMIEEHRRAKKKY